MKGGEYNLTGGQDSVIQLVLDVFWSAYQKTLNPKIAKNEKHLSIQK